MNVQTQIDKTSPRATEHFDVLIAGAGISGVGAAYHLTTQCPGTSFVALEAQKTFGGTWTTHRYPGIRSDSDLHTFGYRFKPWTSAPIASAAEILKYMGDVIEENDLARTSAISTPSPRRNGRARKTSGPSRPRAPTPARSFASPPISSGCARAITATPRAIRRSGRTWPNSRARSSIRRNGLKISTTRTSASS